MDRRDFLIMAGAAAASSAMVPSPVARLSAQAAHAGDAPDAKLLDDLIAANRVLADQGILDAYGAVSVRHSRANRFLMSRSLAAELVTAADILEYDFSGEPIDPAGARVSTPERYIHSEIYKVRADVQCIIHCHTPSLIPFGVTKVPLRPLYHMSYFIAQGVPVYEIRETGGMTDTFVRDARLGKALAQVLGDKPAVLQRGHGAVIVGDSIIAAVGRSVYPRHQRPPSDPSHRAGRIGDVSRSGRGPQAGRTERLRPGVGNVEAKGDRQIRPAPLPLRPVLPDPDRATRLIF
jgi:HCOMODA/2-hydroxy-3-carboxy-muconic semialdehyde decarboxylase